MTTSIFIAHGNGAFQWRGPVESAQLNGLSGLYHVRLETDTGNLKYFDGANWKLVGADIAAGIKITDLTAETGGAISLAGQIGEVIENEVAVATSVGVGLSGDWGSVTSIALTAGVWEISAVSAFKENGAVLTTSLSAGISDSATAVGIGALDIAVNPATMTGLDTQMATPKILVNLSAPKTYYLNSRFFYSSGSPQHYGKIVARRYR